MLKAKLWILNLITAIAFFVASLLYSINVNYPSSIIFLFCGLIFLIISRINYKKMRKEVNK
ncbi:hypothetical protein [Clostridium sp. YIM B02551]|uniref:hypothetical protein n=1 Tax=Clostridium sp. YIM B02551 TaxID=2910679 RepID=UPI001EEB4C22|nr:hypothetical protein [Clostridium sp. YIM B02551]